MGLTTKQSKFAEAVGSGSHKTLSDAYKTVYKASSMSPSAINTEASRLAAHPNVAPMIQKLSQKEIV